MKVILLLLAKCYRYGCKKCPISSLFRIVPQKRSSDYVLYKKHNHMKQFQLAGTRFNYRISQNKQQKTSLYPCLISMKLKAWTHEYLNIKCWKCHWDRFCSVWDMARESQKLGGAFIQAGAFIWQNTVSCIHLHVRGLTWGWKPQNNALCMYIIFPPNTYPPPWANSEAHLGAN